MLDDLIASIDRFCGQWEGLCPTSIPNLTLFRATVPEVPIERSMETELLEPSLCVVVQGSKQATLGARPFLYEAEQYSIISVDLPATNILVNASAKKPFLGLTLKLDAAALFDMLLAVPEVAKRQVPNWGMTPSPLTEELIDCLTRLVKALANPQDAVVLAPLIERETVYRLVCGPQSILLRAATSPTASPIVSASLERGFVLPLAKLLDGKHAAACASLVTAVILGTTTMRFALSSESMERSSRRFLTDTLATAIQACIDGASRRSTGF